MQVNLVLPLLVHGGLEDAVPMLSVNAAVMHAGTDSIAVIRNLIQSNVQIVIILC